MSVNIIDSIINLIKNPITRLQTGHAGRNRVNNMGDALEQYVQDLFIDGFKLNDQQRNQVISQHFSYLGNSSNPPDAMLKDGDAIEVKKIESKNANLALNSSYPKAKLTVDNPMLTQACRNAEDWIQKDMLYAVGVVKGEHLQALSFVYGIDYMAEANTYTAIKERIKQGVETIQGVEFNTATKELGRVNRIDPLGITYLRVRGMWGIQNPFQVFNYVYQRNYDHTFNFMAIINDEKWASFNNTNELLACIEANPNASISSINIKNPNNPAQLNSAKLIQFYVTETEE